MVYPHTGLPEIEPFLDSFTISSPMLNTVITVCAAKITITLTNASDLDNLIFEQLDKIFRHKHINILE